MAEKKVPGTRRVKTPISSNMRDEILAAAIQVFSQKTFEGASLSEIAQAANISHPLVHYHFGSKEKLWKAAVEHVWSNLRHDYRAIIEASVDIQPIDTLKILCRAYGHFATKHPQHIGMITNEIRSSGPRLDWLIDNYILPIHRDMNQVIQKAIDMGQVKKIPMFLDHVLPDEFRFIERDSILITFCSVQEVWSAVRSQHDYTPDLLWSEQERPLYIKLFQFITRDNASAWPIQDLGDPGQKFGALRCVRSISVEPDSEIESVVEFVWPTISAFEAGISKNRAAFDSLCALQSPAFMMLTQSERVI